MKPRLTGKVMRGLITLAGFVEAGSCADILGYDEDANAEIAKDWDDICRACDWVREMQNHRNTKSNLQEKQQ